MTSTTPHFGTDHDGDHPDRSDEWTRLRRTYLREKADRPASTARGVHHQALLSSDVVRTIGFYQDLLEFPLTDLFENRDYEGSTHFFFDIGNGNALAFFDFPGLGLGPYQEVLGGHHHLAISVERARSAAVPPASEASARRAQAAPASRPPWRSLWMARRTVARVPSARRSRTARRAGPPPALSNAPAMAMRPSEG